MQNQIRTIASVIIIIALLLGNSLFLGGHPASANGGEALDLSKIELPEKGNPKLDSSLNQLVSAHTSKRATGFAQENNIELVGGGVRVIIECLPDQVDAAAKAAGSLGVVETSYDNLLQVTVPVSQLTALADKAGIRLVRLPRYPLPDVVSEGVALISADDWQTGGYTGAGVKIAILDLGFTGYSSLLGTELPSSVTTRSFYTGSNIEGYTAHGTACAEIVYDIAPDAQFYLANFGTEVEMGNAVNWLIAQGVKVISCSVGWPVGGPGDGTGTICEMVDNARAAGIVWSQSIGNSAQLHWQGDFVDTEPEPDRWHEFSPGIDESNAIYVSNNDTIIVALKWDDPWGSSGNNYDLYLFDSMSPDPVAWSKNIQDGDDDPLEGFSYNATDTGYYHIAIYKYSATRNVNFHLYSYRHNLQYQVASSSFAIPADSANALAVGAVPWDYPTTIESFSSRGPTTDNRTKPDLVAPDGVSTATYGASAFYGTSASAPHVAGAAALVNQRYPSYTPAQIQAFLEGRAIELGPAGKDNLYGSGRLDLGSPPALTPPAVTTDNASNVTITSARLNGNLTSLGDYSSANVSFEWGTTTGNLTQETSHETMNSTSNFSAVSSGLLSDTTYYFRAKATSDNVTVCGDELSFSTGKAPPAVTTNAADNITTSSATLHGSLDSLGDYSSANVSFEWGTSSDNLTQETTHETMNSTGNFSAVLSGLLSDTTYFFKVKAATDNLTAYGAVKSFTTANQSPTRLVTNAPNVVSPGDNVTMSVVVHRLPDMAPAQTAGMPILFNYVIYKLQSGTIQSGSTTANTSDSGTATLALTAPMETSVILVDTVFLDYGDLLASSNMKIISVLPIVEARLTATSTGGNVTFHLQDQYGNPMDGKALTFLTTSGSLSQGSGVTSASGDVSVTLSGADSAVVSASFGGYISPQGWAYQPTMARITVNTETSAKTQTRLVTNAPNVVSPGDNVTMSVRVYQLPEMAPAQTAGMPILFNYVIYKLQSGTVQSGSTTTNTSDSGIASVTLTAPMETSVILVDAVFLDYGDLLASSNMKIISAIPIIEAQLTATSTGGNVTFHLQDQYGNPMGDKALTFLTTSGSLSQGSGVTSASGDVSVTLSGADSAVVSASFGGYISPQGWAYQPTMARITVIP